MQTARLANINLFVHDADQAYQFYQRVFGFELDAAMNHLPDFLVLNVGGATLSFQEAQAIGMTQELVGGTELGFEVADVNIAVALPASSRGPNRAAQSNGLG